MNQSALFFGSKILTAKSRIFLSEQASIVYGIFKKSPKHERVKKILVAIGSLLSTVGALERLSEDDRFYNASVMIARGYFEGVVNICYLLTCSDDEFNNYYLYTIQKAYRRLDQEFKAGDQKIKLEYSGKKEPKKGSELDIALKKFTTKKGKEIRRWTNTSIPERIKIIGENSESNIGHFLIYQTLYYTDASESLHGSLYGFLFHTGVFTPGETPEMESLEMHMEKNHTTLFMNTGSLLFELIKTINSVTNISKEQDEASKSNERFVKQLSAALKKS
ncbi:MAG: DUF5677 domain-containing protein [bacterium]